MGPRIGEQRLKSVGEAMAELGLEGVVVRARAISHQVELAGEVRVGRVVEVLAHQLAASGSDVGEGDHIGLSETSFHRRVPLIGSGQDVIRVYDGEIRDRRCRGKGRRSRVGGAQRKRSLLK